MYGTLPSQSGTEPKKKYRHASYTLLSSSGNDYNKDEWYFTRNLVRDG